LHNKGGKKMKKMRTTIAALLMLAAMATLVAAQEAFSDPFSSIIWTKVIPVVQGIGSTLAVLAAIYAAILRQSGDPEKVEQANKVFLGIAISLIIIWIAPAFVKWFITLIKG